MCIWYSGEEDKKFEKTAENRIKTEYYNISTSYSTNLHYILYINHEDWCLLKFKKFVIFSWNRNWVYFIDSYFSMYADLNSILIIFHL